LYPARLLGFFICSPQHRSVVARQARDFHSKKNINLKEKSAMTALRSKPIFHIFILFALLASLLGNAIGITPAYAATLTVTNTNDSGAGSLRDIIASAGAGDTITFDSALSGGTIYLASTLTLNQNVTIDGSALASKITISGDSDNDTTGDVRVLSVNSGVTATLDSLIITKGAAGGGDGGGIFTNGATLTINNSTLSGNSAGSYGGGISNTGTLTINNSTLSGNSGGYGGGIHNALTGTLTITNSTLTGNSATSAGGGIHSGGVVTINNSTLSGNSTSSTGGSIYNDGTLTVTDSTLSSNSASASGGGIYSNSGTLTVTDSTLSGNTTTLGSGAGIYNFGSTLTVANSTFSGNSASGSGGGVYNYPGNTLNITNSTFSGNSALYGGGIINYGALMITNSTLSGNIATNNGGGIYNDTAPLNYANTIIANSPSGGDCYNLSSIGTNTNNLVEDTTCSATFSGDPNLGALADNGGSTQTLVLLTGSSAINAGDDTTCTNAPVGNLDQRGVTRPVGAHCDIGAVEANPQSASPFIVNSNGDTNGTCDEYVAGVSDCTLREAIARASPSNTINFDSGLSGGTIHLASTLILSKNVTIDGSALASKITISGDTDSNATGDVRVFLVNSGVTVTLNALMITKGWTTSNGPGGGGIYNVGGTLTIMNSTLSDNSAGFGGGIQNDGTLTVTNSTFSGNAATLTVGGGIENIPGSTLIVTNSTFRSNSAASLGGGIQNYSTLMVTNSTFSGNSAVAGGGILNSTGTLMVTNSTFSGNSGANGGSGIYNYSTGTLNYANTIIANSASGSDCFNSATLGTNTNNLAESGSCSASLSGDPGLGALANNGGPTQTFALLVNSPAIGAGDDIICAAVPVGGLDQRGVTRPQSGHCDIGAYEYVDISAPTITSFSIPSPSSSLNIPITAFTASDDVSATGYKITESAIPPVAGAAGWSGTAPTAYTVGSDGTYTLYPWAKDAAGNVSAVFGSPTSVHVDTSAPTILSSVRVNPNPTAATSVDFIVTFSESVTGVDAADFSLTTTGSISGAVISGVNGSGTTYTVTINTGSGLGTIRLDVADNDSIVDAVSNPLGGSGAGNGAFTSGETYTERVNRIYLSVVLRG
jgi:hypothetical protein